MLNDLGRVLAGSPSAHPVRIAALTAARRLLSFQPAKIVGEPDVKDALNLVDDLNALCAIIDPLIAAVGEYVASNIPGIDQSLFHDQLLGALQGNATHAIESAARDYVADFPRHAAERRAEFNR